MAKDHENDGLTDKAQDAAEKIKDALEPSESDGPNRPSNDASDPFSNDQRPDEAGFPHGSVGGTD
ncbi:hypothetical protein [Actinomycetospora sp.]|jgi:hypothetical protein|uniref:hypothetical protein n=1 Tax=Actinomycetospora sp. TaxID=1872135 RepID=UPI002F41BED0